MIKMMVSCVAVDSNNMPLVILEDEAGKWMLPIWVGLFEAKAILMALEQATPPRPLTHDLLTSVIEQLGARLNCMVINAIHDNTYFARLQLSFDSSLIEIDARPSDAIALALRLKCPIYVTEPVLSTITMPQEPIGEDEVNRFKEHLKDLKVSDITQLF